MGYHMVGSKGSSMFALQRTLTGNFPLKDQLEPQMYGGPNPQRSKEDL